jgi:hypothetical protein
VVSKPFDAKPMSVPMIAGTTTELAFDPRLDGTRKGESCARFLHVLFHPVHLACLGTLFVIGALSASLWVFMSAFVVEVIALGMIPRTRLLRRRVEQELRQKRRREAARIRAQLAGQMDAMHREELWELERRIDAIRSNASSHGTAMESLLDDFVGLDRLLGSYVRLSIAYRAARESLAMTDKGHLEAEIRRMEMEREASPTQRLRRLADRQLSLLRRRVSCLEGNEEDCEALRYDITAIAAMCRLVHERSTSLIRSRDAQREVERIAAEIEEHDDALGELAGLCASVDPMRSEMPTEDDFDEVDDARHAPRVRIATAS